MQAERSGFEAIAVDDNIYIAGGVIHSDEFQFVTSDIEIMNANNYSHSNLCLSNPGMVKLGSKNNNMFFMHSEKNQIDIYNTSTRQWSVAEYMGYQFSITTVNNEIYLLFGIWGNEGRELYKMNF